MTNRLTDLAAAAGLIFIAWVIATRFHVVYDASVCWTSCG
jgi:hypothetical protein